MLPSLNWTYCKKQYISFQSTQRIFKSEIQNSWWWSTSALCCTQIVLPSAADEVESLHKSIFFCHFFICSPNFHFFGHFSFILTIFKLLQDPLIQPHHNHPTSSAFIFQLELILNKAEGGDISTYVPNGEWDLIGKLCRQKCERTDIIKKQSRLAIFRNFGILEREKVSAFSY